VRGKSLVVLSLILALATSLASVNVVRATDPITVKIDPATNVYEPTDTFSVSVLIENSPDISGWEFKIGWDFNVLLFPPEATEGNFLSYLVSDGDEWYYQTQFYVSPNQAGGYVRVSCILKEPRTVPPGEDPTDPDIPEIPPSGDGTLATITFKVLVGGVTSINLFDVKLIDYWNANHVFPPNVIQGASFRTHKPFVDFTWTPAEPDVGTEVTFDGSACWDPDGGEIATYAWDFGDGSPVEVIASDPIATHTYTAYQLVPYTVTLTATDDQGQSWYKSKPIRFWRDVGIPDLWNDESCNLDYNSHIMRRDFDMSLQLISITNFGSMTESFDVTLTVTNDATGDEGFILPLWDNPVTVGAGLSTGVYALWLGPVYGFPVPEGYYTMTATAIMPGDLVPANNALSTSIRLIGANLVMKRITNHAFSISKFGDTLDFYGKIENTQLLTDPPGGITGRVVFEIETPLGETVVLKTDTVHLMNAEMSSQLMVSLGPLTEADIGIYHATAYCEYSADGGLSLELLAAYLANPDVGAGLTISEKVKTFSFSIKA
jgi:hypothetical protein